MPNVTLYAYAEGKDFDSVVSAIEERLDALVAERKWISKDVWVVNQREPPHWDLGLNLGLASAKRRRRGWTDDVVAIATALVALRRETGRNFVIGIHDPKSNATKDVFVVDRDRLDLDRLRDAVERQVRAFESGEISREAARA